MVGAISVPNVDFRHIIPASLFVYATTTLAGCLLCFVPFGPIYLLARAYRVSSAVFASLLGVFASASAFALLGIHPLDVLPWLLAGACTGFSFHRLVEKHGVDAHGT